MKAKGIKYFIFFMALLCLGTECQKEGQNGDPEPDEEYNIVLTITPSTGPANSIFTFSAEGSNYILDYITYTDMEYKWDFNYLGYGDIYWDTELSNNPVQTFIYDSPGTYQVILHVNFGTFTDTETKTIVVTEDLNEPIPTAYFEVLHSPGYPHISIFAFLNGSTDNQDPYTMLQVRWDWEDDDIWDTEFTIQNNTNHTYTAPGEYTVKMEVMDTDSLTDLAYGSVEVLGPGGEPCPGLETVSHGGYPYPTVQIGEQCWLKENLKIGTMILNTALPSQNNPEEIIEKYCYDNKTDSCEKYGGLYSWDEMMQYTMIEGAQGICPNDWHIPTDEEWKILEGAIDSQYNYPDPEWDKDGLYRGSNIGTNIKSQSYWYYWNVGNDKFGFDLRPSGKRKDNNNFDHIGTGTYFWTSNGFTEYSWQRGFGGNQVQRVLEKKAHGFSVRCLKN